MDEAFKSFFSCPKNRTLKKEEIEAREGLEAFRARLLFRFFFDPKPKFFVSVSKPPTREEKKRDWKSIVRISFLSLSPSGPIIEKSDECRCTFPDSETSSVFIFYFFLKKIFLIFLMAAFLSLLNFLSGWSFFVTLSHSFKWKRGLGSLISSGSSNSKLGDFKLEGRGLEFKLRKIFISISSALVTS